MRILALNAGSRSHRAQLLTVGEAPPLDPPDPLWENSVEASDGGFVRLLENFSGAAPDAIGHRVVHPGPSLMLPAARIDDRVQSAIEAAVPLAREHNPLALEGIAAARARFGAEIPNVAVFDVALPSDAPPVATNYGVPLAWRERYGIRRYGFHGISQRDAIARIDRLYGLDPARRIVSVHLGSGDSISAIRGITIVDTTMGLTPMEGLVMGSRSGSIDPGAILYLIREAGLDPADVERTLNEESGLCAMSGSADARDVQAAIDSGDVRARLAMDVYIYRMRLYIGAMAAALGGIDLLSFTGPVGEHVASIRRDVTAQLGFLGVRLDTTRNETAQPDCDIAADTSTARACVIRTLEEWAIARITAAVCIAAPAATRR